MSVCLEEGWEADRENFLAGAVQRTRMFLPDSQLGKIKSQVIAQAGFGGIGSIVLELLVRMRVMKFRLMDMDRYEISNINRQIFATTDTLGKWKADVAASRIKEINPYAEVEMVINEKANRENAEKLLKGADVFILGTDSPSSILIFHELAREHRVPLVDGHCISVTGGSVQVFDYRDPKQVSRDRLFRSSTLNFLGGKILGQRESLRDTTDDELQRLDKGEVPTASLNFVTNLLGCMIVSETIKLITGLGKTYLYPKEIYVDLLEPRMKIRSARSLGNAARRIGKRFSEEKDHTVHFL